MQLFEEEYKFNHIKNLLSLERQKKAVFQKIKERYDGDFSYCCSNPPYIGEKGNKELFRSTLQRFSYWKPFYQGKMNYLYFFIILGLSKLHNSNKETTGGKLGYITTSYWITADGASKLRNYILENAKIKEIILFKDVKIFKYAKGQHNMIFILEKCAGKDKEDERAENEIKIVSVLAKHQEIPGYSIREKLRFLAHYIQKHIDKSEWQDKYIEVFWSGVKQMELHKDGEAWNDILLDKKNLATFRKIENRNKPLSEFLNTNLGIVPGIDKVTSKNLEQIPKWKLENGLIKEGDGVFILSKEEAERIVKVDKDKELLIPSYQNSNIAPYLVHIPKGEEKFILYIDKETDLNKYPGIKIHLDKYHEMLKERLHRYEKKGYKESYPWYRLNRPRNRGFLESEKIVVSNWGNEWQPYAYQTGHFFEKRDITIFVKRSGVRESIFYFLAILNSKLIKQWMNKKAWQLGYMRQKLQEQIPIRCIDFDNPEEFQLHDIIVQKVMQIREKMTKLVIYSKYFMGKFHNLLIYKDPLPDINPESIVQALSPEKQFSLRTLPDIKIIYGKDFEETKYILNKIGKVDLTLEGPEFKLISKNRKVILIRGQEELLKIISNILENHKNEYWTSIKELPIIPKNVKDYKNKKQTIIEKVANLRTEIQKIQTSIDEIIFKLYNVSKNGL
ncbi:hypothetical protein ES703_101374 [subsurface metagenome]